MIDPPLKHPSVSRSCRLNCNPQKNIAPIQRQHDNLQYYERNGEEHLQRAKMPNRTPADMLHGIGIDTV